MPSHGRRGPIAFLLARLPACIAIVGAGLIASPRLFFYLIVRHIESTGSRPPGTTTPDDLMLAIPGGVTLGTVMSIFTVIGAVVLPAAGCLATRNRFRT